MKKSVYLIVIALLTAMYFGCSDDDKSPTKPKPDTILKVTVMDKTDSSVVANSNVVVYEAATGQSVTRDLTDAEGECYFKLDQGDYYLQVSAQGYDPSPAPNVTPVPFFVSYQDTTEIPNYLNANPTADSGFIKGFVNSIDDNSAVNNVLVQAVSSNGTEKYASVSGPDGFFILYNLSYDTYSFEALKAGFKMDAAVNSTIDAANQTDSVTVAISAYTGSSMTGTLSFIAGAEAKPTDMVLRDPISLEIIPGMVTIADTTGGNNGYTFNNIPDGDFILWASLANDENVMDPDKNLGGIDVSFPANDGLDKPIDITGAIIIHQPTNPMDSIYAAVADSIIPTFVWEANSSYGSVKEWVIEVRDLSGNILWGGFEADGTINHPQIPKQTTSVEYNFDNNPDAPDLIPGEIYQWKIYADDNLDPGVQQLLSVSEDLRGIFTVPPAVK